MHGNQKNNKMKNIVITTLLLIFVFEGYGQNISNGNQNKNSCLNDEIDKFVSNYSHVDTSIYKSINTDRYTVTISSISIEEYKTILKRSNSYRKFNRKKQRINELLDHKGLIRLGDTLKLQNDGCTGSIVDNYPAKKKEKYLVTRHNQTLFLMQCWEFEGIYNVVYNVCRKNRIIYPIDTDMSKTYIFSSQSIVEYNRNINSIKIERISQENDIDIQFLVNMEILGLKNWKVVFPRFFNNSEMIIILVTNNLEKAIFAKFSISQNW